MAARSGVRRERGAPRGLAAQPHAPRGRARGHGGLPRPGGGPPGPLARRSDVRVRAHRRSRRARRAALRLRAQIQRREHGRHGVDRRAVRSRQHVPAGRLGRPRDGLGERARPAGRHAPAPRRPHRGDAVRRPRLPVDREPRGGLRLVREDDGRARLRQGGPRREPRSRGRDRVPQGRVLVAISAGRSRRGLRGDPIGDLGGGAARAARRLKGAPASRRPPGPQRRRRRSASRRRRPFRPA